MKKPAQSTGSCSYSHAEEVANAATHGVGFTLSILGLVLLLTKGGEEQGATTVISYLVYGISLILLYFVSTVYHLLRDDKAKRRFRIYDHCCIFFLIAGTYTPFMVITLGNRLGYSILAAVWVLAIAGTAISLMSFRHQEKLRLTLYVATGWMVLIALNQIWVALPEAGIAWLFAGGMFYTVGIVFYLWRALPHHHAIWHLFVLAGSVSHFIVIYFHHS